MSEENENKPTGSHSGFTDSSSDVESKLAQIEELQGKIRLLRWGLFIGVLAIMSIGILTIWGTTKKAAEPAVQVYNEAKDVFDGVQGKIDAAQNDYNRIEPKATKAYQTVKGLMSRDSKEWKKLQSEFKDNLAEEIKPAAERLAKTVLIDIQDDVLEKFDEVSSHADEFMYIARNEYQKTTNSIPNSISEAIEQTLIKTISERDAKMREMFPKLTKEKQAKAVSRLSSFSKKESEKVFIALFADHLSEFGKMQDSMNKIYTKESEAGAIASNKSSVGTTLALLSSLIDIAMREFDDLGHSPKTPKKDPKAEDPKSKDKPTSPAKTLAKEKKPEPEKNKVEPKKVEPKKEDTSSKRQ